MTSQQLERYPKKYHCGETEGITATELQRLFRTTPKLIRSCVNALRQEGVPICSGNSGYYYAATSEELGRSIRHLTNRICNIAVARRGLVVSMNRLAERGEKGGDADK